MAKKSFADVEREALAEVLVEQILKQAIGEPLATCIFNHKLAGLNNREISKLTLVPAPQVAQTLENARQQVEAYLRLEEDYVRPRITAAGVRIR